MNIKVSGTRILCVLALCISGSNLLAQQPSSSPQETLAQDLLLLRQNPADRSLRASIIGLSLNMRPRPAIPEEAHRHFVQAATIQKNATDSVGMSLAIDEYEQALLIAPWWPEAYYDLGVALQSVKRYDDASDNLNLYLLTDPAETDARDARDRVYAIEAQKTLARTESAARAAAEHQRQVETVRETAQPEPRRSPEEEFLNGLNGARYIHPAGADGGVEERDDYFEIRGTQIFKGAKNGSGEFFVYGSGMPIVGKTFTESGNSWCNGGFNCDAIGTISDDGSQIRYETTYAPAFGGRRMIFTYRRVR